MSETATQPTKATKIPGPYRVRRTPNHWQVIRPGQLPVAAYEPTDDGREGAMSHRDELNLGELRARLTPAMDYLQSHWRTATFRTAAKVVHLSPLMFHRMFVIAFAQTPKDVTTAAQVAEAKAMLATGFACCKVWKPCGFATFAHLSQRFKQVTGMTPTAWLRDQRRQAAQRAA